MLYIPGNAMGSAPAARESHIGNRVGIHQSDGSKLGPGKGHRVTIGLTTAVSCNRKRFGCDTCCQSGSLGKRVVPAWAPPRASPDTVKLMPLATLLFAKLAV